MEIIVLHRGNNEGGNIYEFHTNKRNKVKPGYLFGVLIIIFFDCKNSYETNQNSPTSKSNNSVEVVNDSLKSDSINPYWNSYENINLKIEIVAPELINDTLIRPFNGIIAINDLNKFLILDDLVYPSSDSIMLVDFKIFGYSPKDYRILNILRPYFSEDYKINIEDLTFGKNKKVIIPYIQDPDGNTTIFTIWKQKNDSLEYEGYYKNIFISKYSDVFPTQFYEVSGNTYLLGKTNIGEGGGYAEEYWIGKVTENNILQINSIYSTGWDVSDDTIKTLTFNRNKNTLLFYENFYKNTNESINEKDYLFKKKVAKFELR